MEVVILAEDVLQGLVAQVEEQLVVKEVDHRQQVLLQILEVVQELLEKVPLLEVMEEVVL